MSPSKAGWQTVLTGFFGRFLSKMLSHCTTCTAPSAFRRRTTKLAQYPTSWQDKR